MTRLPSRLLGAGGPLERDPSHEETLRLKSRSARQAVLSPTAVLVRRHDRDRFQTALFAPARKREALFALYAFNYEIARVRESVSEEMLGLIRLQWWREAITAAYGDAPPRRHEIVEAVTAAIRERRLSRAHFDWLIDTRERDLDDAPPASLAALEDYAEGSSAALIYLALEVLDAATPVAREAGRHVGIAYALAGLLRAMPVHASTGRSFMPEDIATEAGLDPRDYSALRTTAALRQAVRIIAEAASGHLAAAGELQPKIPAGAMPALLPARIAATTLRRLERAGFDPFSSAALRPDPLQSWRLAWAAWRGRL
jgi:NADH dehydrogenase [ubiquinone] 1 alpha subcomplex assembly factor 6